VTFDNDILKELIELESPLAGLSRKIPYRVPPGYFEALPEILSESAATSSFTVVRSNPMKAPEGYFDVLPNTLLQAALASEKETKKSKSIPFISLWSKRLVRMAAAAILVSGVSIGAYTYLQPAPAGCNAAEELAQLDPAVIDEYIELHVDEFDNDVLESSLLAWNTDLSSSVSRLDAAEIDQYLEEEAGINDSGITNAN